MILWKRRIVVFQRNTIKQKEICGRFINLCYGYVTLTIVYNFQCSRILWYWIRESALSTTGSKCFLVTWPNLNNVFYEKAKRKYLMISRPFSDTCFNTIPLVSFIMTINGLIFLSRCTFKVFLMSRKIDNTLDNPMAIQKEDKQASRVFDNEKENRFSERRHQN